MTRKAAWAGFSFWAALMLAAAFRSEMNMVFLLTAFGLAAVGLAALKKHRCHVIVCLVFFTVGILLNGAYTRLVYNRLVALDGQVVTVKGHINDYSQIDGKYDRVVVDGKVNGISCEISFVLPYDDFRYYDEIEVTDEVSLIEDGVKFDSGTYNYSKGVFLQGGYSTGSYVLTGRSVNAVFRSVKLYRDKLFSLITDTCQGREGAFLGAMLCGDKSEMSSAMKTELYRSGLGHIFAVSGIHLVIAVRFFSFIAQKLIKSKRLVYALTLIEIWGFAVFAGLSVSVVRAAVMLTLTRSSFWFGRKSDGLNSLGLCAILLTAFEPYAAISPSFVLSFAAVLAIEIVSLSHREAEGSKAEVSLRTSSAVLFATAPASAGFFGGVSVMSIVSNLLLVPVCTLSLQLCFAVLLTGGIPVIAKPLLRLSALPVRGVLFCADALSLLDYCYVFTAHRALYIIVILSSLIMLYLAYRQKNGRRYLLLTLTVLAVWCAAANICRAADNDIRITVLPSGRKTAYIVSCQGKAVLFDVGAKGRLDGAAQRQLDKLGISQMPYAFISEQGALTAAAYEEDFFLRLDVVFIGDDPLADGDDKLMILKEGDTADMGFISVTPTAGGYEVSFGGEKYLLGKGKIVISSHEVDISKEKTVLVLEGTTLRRT
ncbi:ComEC/Rec2 family competence protein [Ruminococcus sp.]|uniref:ComEC/Rec2 family competence protein n=1 Tax=Ruminococcus sp. TaxID=41978 RepID=UPI0025FB3628|nr:ComEC/Rec2 family competence protein [Ruminococcus sp.]MBQ8965379.1 ComEC/Rec2 family competence protein [Ruminococcus sp.]